MILQPFVLLVADVVLGQNNAFGDWTWFLPLLAIGFLFYFMIVLPERRNRAEQEKLRQGLKKNDRIITIGGIYGTVVNAQQGADDITIKVDENSNIRLRITRSSVHTVLNKEKESGEKKETK